MAARSLVAGGIVWPTWLGSTAGVDVPAQPSIVAAVKSEGLSNLKPAAVEAQAHLPAALHSGIHRPGAGGRFRFFLAGACRKNEAAGRRLHQFGEDADWPD